MFLIVFGSIGILLIAGLVQWSLYQVRLSRQRSFREKAFEVAEAGIEYYRWHLAHAPEDFLDGGEEAGPFVHPYYDKSGARIGEFTLDITPPAVGSTMVTLTSAGITDEYPNSARVLRARYAVPSLAKYAIASNAHVRIGENTEVFGPIHSNGGIRFDGVAHNLVTSAQSAYNDPDHDGSDEFGVHTHVNPVDPIPPAAIPSRPDVFMTGRIFPVPAIDFAGITADLAELRTLAIGELSYFAPSGKEGYRITLNANGTYTVESVDSLISPPIDCTNTQGQAGWGTWSVGATSLVGTYAFPPSGVIFSEDHLWVEGVVDRARLTIVSAKFPEDPSTNTSITINNDLRYTAYDGSSSVGLIAQNNINAGLKSEDDLRIDAALVAKNGRAGRYYYSSTCGTEYQRAVLTLWGMIASNLRYGFAYTNGTGYLLRYLDYDSALLYGPPPSFPLTSEQYQIVSWEEVK